MFLPGWLSKIIGPNGSPTYSLILCGSLAVLMVPVAVSDSSRDVFECFTCGSPGQNSPQSYRKSYNNHSCSELWDGSHGLAAGNGLSPVWRKFLRRCPRDVTTCYTARGLFDLSDQDPSNDLTVQFLGCSEGLQQRTSGCVRDNQVIVTKNGTGHRIKVNGVVNVCFCSETRCNHPQKILFDNVSDNASYNWRTARGPLTTLLGGLLLVLTCTQCS